MSVKNPWVWAWLVAAGVVVGFIFGRHWGGPEEAVAPSGVQTTDIRQTASDPAGASQSTVVMQTTQSTVPAPATSPADAPSAAAPPVPPPVAAAGRLPFMPAVDSGVVTPIDAGDVFARQIARPATSDNPNQLGEAHRELEREPRDEGWAYTMEADLQNSMISETSMGKFKLEHVECRTTICEVRVSGSGDQADAVRAWSNAIPSNTFNQQLFMNVSSTISSHERIDAIYIFRRPARNP